jgi:hypothetical protein
MFIRSPAEHMEKEDAAVDFFRLHPVKMKRPTDNRSPTKKLHTPVPDE